MPEHLGEEAEEIDCSLYKDVDIGTPIFLKGSQIQASSTTSTAPSRPNPRPAVMRSAIISSETDEFADMATEESMSQVLVDDDTSSRSYSPSPSPVESAYVTPGSSPPPPPSSISKREEPIEPQRMASELKSFTIDPEPNEKSFIRVHEI